MVQPAFIYLLWFILKKNCSINNLHPVQIFLLHKSTIPNQLIYAWEIKGEYRRWTRRKTCKLFICLFICSDRAEFDRCPKLQTLTFVHTTVKAIIFSTPCKALKWHLWQWEPILKVFKYKARYCGTAFEKRIWLGESIYFWEIRNKIIVVVCYVDRINTNLP